MSWHQWQGDTLELKLYIQPGAQRTQVMGLYLDRLKVRIAAPPVEGVVCGLELARLRSAGKYIKVLSD
jgi:uncharacterized protein YggU (UPF0235/DUF167 family)